jgi:hypothetical protein
MRYACLRSLKELLVPLCDELQSISDDTSTERDARAKAAGFLRFFRRFEFCILLGISCELFEVTDRLSKVLQSAEISVCEGKAAAETVVKQIRSWRCEEHFSQLWENANVMSTELDNEPSQLPRPKRLPKRLDEGSATTTFDKPEDYFRTIYFNILDEATGCIENRFTCKGYGI